MKPSNNDKWYVNDDGYLCDEMGECVDIQTEAERIVKAVNTHERAILLLKEELCWQLDRNIATRSHWVDNVKAILTDMEG